MFCQLLNQVTFFATFYYTLYCLCRVKETRDGFHFHYQILEINVKLNFPNITVLTMCFAGGHSVGLNQSSSGGPE